MRWVPQSPPCADGARPPLPLLGQEAQLSGNFGKVAKKSSLVRRFFCCFPLMSFSMPSRHDLPGVGSIESGASGFEASGPPTKLSRGISALAGRLRVTMGSLLGKGGGQTVAWSAARDSGAPPIVDGRLGRRHRASRTMSMNSGGVCAEALRSTHGSASVPSRLPARITASSRRGPQGSEASTARGPLRDGAPGASRSMGSGGAPPDPLRPIPTDRVTPRPAAAFG